MLLTQQNQTLETNQLTNNNKNLININVPQANQPNLLPIINNNPQNIQNFNHQFNPQITQNYNPSFNPQITQNYNPSFNPKIIQNYNPSFNPVIQTAPTQVVVENKLSVRPNRVIIDPIKLELEPKTISCPFCEEVINTKIEKSTNIKALLIAIGTLYIGFVLIQTCRGKVVSWEDCVHSCPNCGHMIGKYYAM